METELRSWVCKSALMPGHWYWILKPTNWWRQDDCGYADTMSEAMDAAREAIRKEQEREHF